MVFPRQEENLEGRDSIRGMESVCTWVGRVAVV